MTEIAKIDQLDCGFSAAHSESLAYFDLHDYPRLIEAANRALLLDPNEWSQHYNLGAGYEGMGKFQQAISEYQKAIEMSGGSQGPAVALAHAYAAVGRRAEAFLLDSLRPDPRFQNLLQRTGLTG